MTKVYRVLIAEDEKAMANALELKLKKTGFEAVAVFDGDSVIKAIEKEKFDIILLDLMMPKTDGFSVMQELKELKNDTPVMVLSNLSQEEDRKRAIDLGAKDYFVKSDTPITEIVQKVASYLKK
jgi:DNA-binding response OmpR family regulator